MILYKTGCYITAVVLQGLVIIFVWVIYLSNIIDCSYQSS